MIYKVQNKSGEICIVFTLLIICVTEILLKREILFIIFFFLFSYFILFIHCYFSVQFSYLDFLSWIIWLYMCENSINDFAKKILNKCMYSTVNVTCECICSIQQMIEMRLLVVELHCI